MSRLSIITKYFVKNALEQGLGGKKKKSWIAMLALTIVVMFCFSAPFITIIIGSYNSLKSLGQEGYLLSFILLMGSMIVLFFGIFNILNTFYFANDIEQILPLPFKSSEVIFGKFITVLIEMYMYALMIVFPLIAYGIISKSGAMFYVYSLIVFLIFPIVPMVLGTILCMIIMRVTNLSKHKDAFTMISGVLMLVVIVAFNIYSQNSGGIDSAETVQNLMQQGNNSMMDAMGNIFFIGALGAKALLYSTEIKGLEYLAIALAISLCLFAIFYIVGGKIYYKSIVGISETYGKRENVFENKKADKTVKKNSPVKALILKDLKIMFRTPQFFINCIAMMIYMPAIFGIAFFSGDNISELIDLIFSNVSYYGYVISGVLGCSILCVCGGGAALTAVSREGRDFSVSKYIPVPVEEQIKAKVILSIAVNEFIAAVLIIILIFVKTPISLLITSGLITILSVALVAIMELFLDYRSPKLEWDTEKDIFKKNFLPLILMMVALALAGICALISFVLKNYIIVFLIIAIITAILIVVFYSKLKKAAYKLYEED